MSGAVEIDAGRLWSRLMELGEIGAIPGGGVDRQALSDGEPLAWARVIGWAEAAGMEAATAALPRCWPAAIWTASPPAAASTAPSG